MQQLTRASVPPRPLKPRPQEYGGAFKVVKVNHTPNPNIIAKYKVGAVSI